MAELTLDKLKALKQDYVDVFSGEKGQRVFADMNRFRYQTTFSKDALTLAFNEGKRSIMLHAENMMRLDLDKLRKQVEEQQKTGGDNV